MSLEELIKKKLQLEAELEIITKQIRAIIYGV
jgi:hypothetical protein